MLQEMNHIEASCIVYVNDGTLNRLEHSKFCILMVSTSRLAMVTVHHHITCRACVLLDPRQFLRHALADVLSIKEGTVFICQRRTFSGRSL